MRRLNGHQTSLRERDAERVRSILRELPRQLASREMQVEECVLLDWLPPGQHRFVYPGEISIASSPAVRIRLTVSSGFYVRSFAHDLGIACRSRSHMTELVRTRQDRYTTQQSPCDSSKLVPAITYHDLDAGEDVWGPKLRVQLADWVNANPVKKSHVDGRSRGVKNSLAEEEHRKPRQRFRGEWVADTKKERIKQQGGKFKGKWSRKQGDAADMKVSTIAEHTLSSV